MGLEATQRPELRRRYAERPAPVCTVELGPKAVTKGFEDVQQTQPAPARDVIDMFSRSCCLSQESQRCVQLQRPHITQACMQANQVGTGLPPSRYRYPTLSSLSSAAQPECSFSSSSDSYCDSTSRSTCGAHHRGTFRTLMTYHMPSVNAEPCIGLNRFRESLAPASRCLPQR